MKYATVVLALASSALASNYARQANGTVVYTTEVVTAYTTYCPVATEIPYGTSTYSATAGETVTITDCPCTITKPVPTAAASTIYYTSCDTEDVTPAPTKVIPVATDTPCPEVSSLTIIPNASGNTGGSTGGSNSGSTGSGSTGSGSTGSGSSGSGSGATNGTSTTGPTQYTGAASAIQVGGFLAAVAAGAAALLL